MTGQTVLNYMEDLNRELELQPGEADVARGLRTLNVAQDYFETLVGQVKGLMGSHTSTVTTTASTETTAFPTGLLRLDSLWFVDPDDSLPDYELSSIDDDGGHAIDIPWPLRQRLVQSPGKPWGYWTNGTSIYWTPLPDATHTIRWYGFQRQTDITAAGTFLYDDGVAFPLAVFAVQILRRGLDDPIGDYIALAEEVFRPQIRMMQRFLRQRAPTRQYRYVHDT